MPKSIYTVLDDGYYAGIITILSYRISLGDYLKTLHFSVRSRPVLIDTAVKGGSNFERFLECFITYDGKLDYKKAILVSPPADLKHKADSILSMHENSVKNSSLSKSQIQDILSTKY